MITALALNPAIDRTIYVPGFQTGRTNRAELSRQDPGGKGINVASVLKALGADVQLLGFLGEGNADVFRRHMAVQGISAQFVTVPGETRVNIKIVDSGTHDLTEINDKGFVVSPAALEDMRAQVAAALPNTAVLVLAGSIPAGVPTSIYREFVAMAQAAGVRTLVDADGEPMLLALSAGPTLIKPNAAEAGRLVGRVLASRAEQLAAAEALRQRGAQSVVLSCGGEGALLVGPDGAWWATPPAIQVGSTVGAGDAMVASLALALDRGMVPAEALRLATAAGAAAASSTGTQVSAQAEIEKLLPLVSVKVALK